MRHALLCALLLAASVASAGGFSDRWLDAGQAEQASLVQAQFKTAAQQARPLMYAEERLCVATLRMKKSNFSLDPTVHLGNWLASQDRDVVASESQCAGWKVGEELSRKFDAVGSLWNGELASYVVKVQAKKIVPSHFVLMSDGKQAELSQAEYSAALAKLKAAGVETVSVPAVGLTRTYVLDKPLSEYKIVSAEPLKRYFINVHVKNGSFSLSLVKHLRNALNTHDIVIEVPKEAYDRAGDAFDERISSSFWVRGRFSELRGKITKKWTTTDPKYVVAATDDGRELILPKSVD